MVNYSISEKYRDLITVNQALGRIKAAQAAGQTPAKADTDLVAAAETGFYGQTQYGSLMSLAEFCQHIASHGSKYNKGDVMAVVVHVVGCLKEQLLAGRKVQLGDLGEFSLSIQNVTGGADSAAEYNPSVHVKALNVLWTPGAEFTDLKSEAEWNYVQSMKVQKMMRRVEKGTATAEDVAALQALLAQAQSQAAASGDDDTPTTPSGTGGQQQGTDFS